MIMGFQLYSQAPNNISMLMAGKMDKISLECFRQVMGLSSGLYTILEQIKLILIVLLEALSVVKKSLSLIIPVLMTPQSTRELLLTVITLLIRVGSLSMTARFQLMRDFYHH
jgi:hypothetical protein